MEVMKQSNSCMEKEILDSFLQADLMKKERLKKMEERKIYVQLHEAMEALIHIYRDGCRTIGPHDKVLKRSSAPCNFPACKGLESLVRHFAGCKSRVLGGFWNFSLDSASRIMGAARCLFAGISRRR